jgi:membrane protein YqaA with SNARE-associated domain
MTPQELVAPRPGLIRRLYDQMIAAAHGPRAMWAMLSVSFAESSFFPIPPDPILIPMMLAQPKRAWWLATLCTIASVLGGILGWAIGYFLYETVGAWIIEIYGLTEGFHEFQQMYAEWGAWIILVKGVTPIPYKLVTITSGLAQFSLPLFILTSVISRGVRFFLVAALIDRYGVHVRHYIEKYTTLFFFGLIAFIILGFASISLLH